MSPLLETIKLKDGKLYNLAFHNRRFNEARKNYFGIENWKNLEKFISIPPDKIKGLFRFRITYSPEIEKIEFILHLNREVRSLKLIEDSLIDYRFKYADRNRLQKLFDLRENCDDILIVKNGCITDSFTANPVFFDGEKWWTPDTPLLPGTQRARYLEEGKISECRITTSDLNKFQKAGLINALWDLEDMPAIEINNILY
ncbi:MAG: aminotransferase class IV [Prolixibacteraceae bacterium]|nr:aminotransferase class IV [Prolixibacteraceae bacterium]